MLKTEDSSKLIGKSIFGRYGTYTFEKEIGHGGNGKVYDVKVQGQFHDFADSGSYVVKVLYLKGSMPKDEKKKREERFRRESEIVKGSLSGIEGIIPILDTSYENENNGCLYPWYLMPKAAQFYFKDYSTEERLNFMLQVAGTLSKMHAKGISHRDIKPDNLLIYRERLCLTDFGLVWTDEFDSMLTGDKESIGPQSIRPRELNDPVKQDGAMFLKSDVYLFAKTLWIVLKEIRRGFYKRYSRTDDDVYIKPSKYTLEPLHMLMEESTYDDYSKRISIDKCLELLRIQIDIINGRIPESEVAKYRYAEASSRTCQKAKADESIIKSDSEISNFLNDFEKCSRMVVSEPGMEVELGILNRVQHLGNHIYRFTFQRTNFKSAGTKDYSFYIREVHFTQDSRCFCCTDYFEDSREYAAVCNRIDLLSQTEEQSVCVDGLFELELVP